MSEFKLDTSGFVLMPENDGPSAPMMRVCFEGLPPFVQGYIKAAFDAHFGGDLQPDGSWKMRVRFSDLHPTTLAEMLKDCEAFRRETEEPDTEAAGHRFFDGRQLGKPAIVRASIASGEKYTLKHFPPLLLSLSDDGKIVQEVKS